MNHQGGINEVDRSRLNAVVGGKSWVTSVADTVGPWVSKDWNKQDCVTRASQVSEVGEFIGASAGFVGGLALTEKLSHRKWASLVTGFITSKASEGVSRQYTFTKYNEDCK